MTGFQTEPRAPSARSPFVTRVAWYSILVYSYATLLSALYGLVPPPAVPTPKVIPESELAMLILGVVEGAASLIFDVVPRFHTVWAVGLIAWAVLCVWITSKLLSAPARAEFQTRGPVS